MKQEIINADCLEVMKGFADKSFDLVLTDPPYGIDYQSNMRVVSKQFAKIENDDNSSRFETYKEMWRILKDDTVAIVFCSWKNYAEDFNELAKLFDIKNCIVWDKGGGVSATSLIVCQQTMSWRLSHTKDNASFGVNEMVVFGQRVR